MHKNTIFIWKDMQFNSVSLTICLLCHAEVLRIAFEIQVIKYVIDASQH